MKKISVLFVLVFGLAVQVFAQAGANPFRKGTYEARVDVARTLLNATDEEGFALGGGLGYYAMDDLLVGGVMSFEDKEKESYWGIEDTWSLGAFTEYMFSDYDPVIPFIGASLALVQGDSDKRDMVAIGSLTYGIKVFPMDAMAVSLQANLNFANEDIYNFERDLSRWEIDPDYLEGEGDNYSGSVTLGARFLFY